MYWRPGVAIDLGTVNTVVYVAGRGIVLDEPSVVALATATRRLAAAGADADAMWGREPEGIDVLWPLRDGVIADFLACTRMLSAFLHKAHVHRGITRPSAVICVPRGATTVERYALDCALREEHPHLAMRLLDEPVAAALGAVAGKSGAEGTFVVDVGGGTTEIAVVASRGVVRARSLRTGGNAMDEAIARSVRAKVGLRIGQRTAEHLKIVLGLTGGRNDYEEVVGVDVAREELRSEQIPGELVAGALDRSVSGIISAVHEVLAATPPSLADDIVDGSIQLAGGGALLLGLAQRIEISTGIKTLVAGDPLHCVVRGAAEVLMHGDGLGPHSSKVA